MEPADISDSRECLLSTSTHCCLLPCSHSLVFQVNSNKKRNLTQLVLIEIQTPLVSGLAWLQSPANSTKSCVPCSNSRQTIPSMARGWVCVTQAQPHSGHVTLSPAPRAQVLLIPSLNTCPFLTPGSVHPESYYLRVLCSYASCTPLSFSPQK